MANRTQFTFYGSFAAALSRIKKKADRADAYDAICNYALYGKEPDYEKISDSVAISFDLIKPTLDASKRKAENGKAGANRKQTASKPQANESKPQANRKQTVSEGKQQANRKLGQTVSEKEGENEIENEIEKENENENEIEKENENENECLKEKNKKEKTENIFYQLLEEGAI